MPLQTTPTASTHVPESCGMGRARFAGSRVVLGAYVSRNFKICASFSSFPLLQCMTASRSCARPPKEEPCCTHRERAPRRRGAPRAGAWSACSSRARPRKTSPASIILHSPSLTLRERARGGGGESQRQLPPARSLLPVARRRSAERSCLPAREARTARARRAMRHRRGLRARGGVGCPARCRAAVS